MVSRRVAERGRADEHVFLRKHRKRARTDFGRVIFLVRKKGGGEVSGDVARMPYVENAR